MTVRKSHEQKVAKFIRAYTRNGFKGKAAAIEAGYAPKNAAVTAAQLLAKPYVKDQLAALTEKTAAVAEIKIEDALVQAKGILQSDLTAYFDDKGEMRPMSEWTPAMRSAVSSIKLDYAGIGKKRRLSSAEIKLWDKNSALAHVMRHLGMFEKDNVQRQPNLQVQLLFVGPPE